MGPRYGAIFLQTQFLRFLQLYYVSPAHQNKKKLVLIGYRKRQIKSLLFNPPEYGRYISFQSLSTSRRYEYHLMLETSNADYHFLCISLIILVVHLQRCSYRSAYRTYLHTEVQNMFTFFMCVI